jgi:hypothetical protein
MQNAKSFIANNQYKPMMRNLVVFALLLIIAGCSLQAEKGCQDCNVVLIVMDTLRAQDLGCFNAELNTSPFIDSFSKNSIQFSNAFSQATTTFPSHMSIFTSRYPSCNQFMVVGRDTLSPAIPTLSQIFKSNGYTTAWVAPLNDMQLSLEAGFEKGYDVFFDSDWVAGVEWMAAQERPVFAFFHTYMVHDPYIPSEESVRWLNETMLPYTEKAMYDLKDKRQDILLNLLANSSFNLWLFGEDLSGELSEFELSQDIEKVLQNFIIERVENPQQAIDTLNIVLSRMERRYFWSLFDVETEAELLHFLYQCKVYDLDQKFKAFIESLKNAGVYNNTYCYCF